MLQDVTTRIVQTKTLTMAMAVALPVETEESNVYD